MSHRTIQFASALVGAATLTALIGCGQSQSQQEVAGPPAVVVVPADFNPEALPTVAIEAPTISCEGCAETVEKNLVQTPGVMDVSVDVDSKVVVVAYKDGVFSVDKAIADLEDASFPGASEVDREIEVSADPGE